MAPLSRPPTSLRPCLTVVVRGDCDATCISRRAKCRPGRPEGPELAIVKSTHSLRHSWAASLSLEGLLQLHPFPTPPPSHLLVPSRPRGLFCLRLRNSLASLHPPAHSPSPFLWNCPLDPTSNPLGTRRRYGRSRFCVAWAWGGLWAEAGTRRDRLVLS